MSKSTSGPPPLPPKAPCEGPYTFAVDRIADAGAVQAAAAVNIGDPVVVQRDASGRPAVFSGGTLLGWPATHERLLADCIERGFVYTGRVVVRRGQPFFPIVEVTVSGHR